MITNQHSINEVVLGVYFDIVKASESINYKLILFKLFGYKFTDKVYDFFKNYLTNRSQITKINSASSLMLIYLLVFIIYINDLLKLSLHFVNAMLIIYIALACYK